MSLDMVVQGGMVVSPRQIFGASVGIKDGRIVAIGNAEYLAANLAAGLRSGGSGGEDRQRHS